MCSSSLARQLDNTQPVLQSRSLKRLKYPEEQQPVRTVGMRQGLACPINQTWFQSIFSTRLPLSLRGFRPELSLLACGGLHFALVLVIL